MDATRASSDQEHDDIVLKPLSRPDLGDIHIDDSVFAVGRTEAPFAAYGNDILAMLSRRHARIFRESGAVYLADLDSRNGTTVNRIDIREAPSQLRDGDEICFGGVLSFRVQITSRALKARPATFTLTLTPESDASDLAPIVITRFPFLVSKADATFSRYQNEHARQVSYLSRRQAHIFQKGGGAYIEDLASTNGTFVDGLRLQEHAVPLQDGVLVAFGGEHFTYRVGIKNESRIEPAPAVARVRVADDRATEPKAVESDKTTFVVAATSFLDIFCADEPSKSAEPSAATVPAVIAQEPAKRRPRGRGLALVFELAGAFAGERDRARSSWWKGAALAAVLVAAGAATWLWGMSERELKDAVAKGDYAQAALLANRALEQRPDDVELKELATEVALKANVPAWLAKLKAGDFDGANAVLAGMSAFGTRNPELRPLVGELQWLGDLQRLLGGRGGPDAPIRIYADEDRIGALIERWNDNTGEHQRTLARIAAHVPQFGVPYAEALTHLRRLQSDATVYLGAIQRLKANIAAELNRDSPQALEGVLKEYAEKYPGLGGLDSVRQDLARYIEIRSEARARKSGRVFSLMLKAQFQTPPFQEAFRALAASGQLPPEPLVRQYAAATAAWKEGKATQALAELQKMVIGPWAEAATKELARRQAVTAQFAALQQSRAASGYGEQLLAFRAALDPEEDSYFARVTEADLGLQKDNALVRAQESMNRAQALWHEYRNNGAIDARQRIETPISNPFRTRALLLSEASRQAQRATQIFAQLNVARPAQWSVIHDEIRTEAELQRSALQGLRNVLDPELLKTKLTLLGERSDDGRKSP
jgi:pSer/pThr/pTyr-binding forkhead associated (FHA) protein